MPHSALAGLRIGCVSYLNARPLIYGLDSSHIRLEVPAKLAESFASGSLDAALLPVFALLEMGGGLVVDDVAIACSGEVSSVLVASRCELAECESIYLDPASRSSSALLQVLLAEYYPGGPRVIDAGEVPEDEPHLIIGDPALAFRAAHVAPWRYHDLGALWEEHTGLPFVFAVWALGSDVRNPGEAAEALRAVKRDGLAARHEIASREKDPAAALEYLTRYIRYDIGLAEKEALRLFASLAHKHGLLSDEPLLTFR